MLNNRSLSTLGPEERPNLYYEESFTEDAPIGQIIIRGLDLPYNPKFNPMDKIWSSLRKRIAEEHDIQITGVFRKDIKGETKKIVWPDAKTVLKSTAVVLVVVIVCALAIYAVDQLLALGLSLLERAAESVGNAGTNAAEVATTVANEIVDHGDHTHVAGMINLIR